MDICLYGASSGAVDKIYVDAVYSLGFAAAKRGHSLIFGGGANGLMGAASRGMKDGGGKTIGVAPKFFNVDGILCDNCDEFIFTDTMRERKQIMEDRAEAFIAVPGGIGTFEEFFEILTLKQLGRHGKPIAIFNVNGYYDFLLDMLERAISEKFMYKNCRMLYEVFDTPHSLIDYIENYKESDNGLRKFKDI